MIYEIRGKQVMLDSDLARLYQCSNGTKSINLAVKRHFKRFPERFMFQLTETEISRFQFETLNKNGQKQGTNIKYLPYVFTEQGVAMLSTILKSKIAIEVSIKIMDAFVEMRTFINENKNIFNRLTIAEYKLLEHDDKINEMFDALETKKIENQKNIF